jgi:DNA-binding SARP family transcriptional activator
MAARSGTGRHRGLRVRLLGAFELTVDGRPVGAGWRLHKAESVVKLLALQSGHRLHQDQLFDLLWPGLPPDAAANQLRKALHVARRALDPAPDATGRFLVRRGQVLAFRPDAVWVDTDAFERAAELARRDRTLSGYQAAIAAYGGELLPDDRYEEWALEPRRQLEGEVADLLVELAGKLAAEGQLERAASSLEAAVARRPFDEGAAGALMRVHALAGRRHEALRRFQTLRRALGEELGVEPGPAIRRLYEEIRGRGADFGRLARPFRQTR